MKREDVFEAWAPTGGPWSLWARPILFAQMPPDPKIVASPESWESVDASWAPNANGCALILDLPADESVWVGLALAGRGYRPVPLYNACTGPHEVIEQQSILQALLQGASYLQELKLTNAAPAFLLDSRRFGASLTPEPGAFDNRWQIFPQDFPSAALLLARGVRRVVLVRRFSMQPLRDLTHVLRRWQEAGIAIEGKDLANEAGVAAIKVDEPQGFRSVWYRILALFGFRRGSIGGFGGVVPQPSHG